MLFPRNIPIFAPFIIIRSMSEKANLKKIESISAQLGVLASEFTPLLTDENIKGKLGQLSRRSLEYKNGSFIMLVVGPVKSGKSTLVNLLAHRYVRRKRLQD